MGDLYETLRNELNITWDDEETESRLIRIIRNAVVTMNRKIGSDIDYSIAGPEQELFLAYCVYVYNNCANQFDENYLNEIMQIRSIYEVEQYEEDQNK